MATVEVVPALAEHIPAIAAAMRAADRQEVAAASGRSPGAALHCSLRVSIEAWTGLIDGRPVCMFGLGCPSLLGGVGVPWLLGTDQLKRHQMAFLRRNRAVVARWAARYPRLINFVDARNLTSIRWLRWLGFVIDPARPYGLAGLPFHPFVLRSDHV